MRHRESFSKQQQEKIELSKAVSESKSQEANQSSEDKKERSLSKNPPIFLGPQVARGKINLEKSSENGEVVRQSSQVSEQRKLRGQDSS